MVRYSLLLSIAFFSVAAVPTADAFQATTKCRPSLKNNVSSNSLPFQRHVHVLSKQGTPSFTRLLSTTDDRGGGTGGVSSSSVDVGAIVKYGSSIAIQLSLIFATFTASDAAVAASGVSIPFPVLLVGFYALSLKSRVFNPLNNDRPNMAKAAAKGEASGGFRDRNMPSWTPPGVVFPIVWLLINAPLRAYASSVAYQATGHFADPAIMAFVLHLSVGDVWNTINNTEKRYGASVSAVLGVWATAVYAATQYYQVDPLAGKLLGGTCIWLTVAATLVTSTWKINPDADGKLDPLYPVVGDATTEFAWFGGAKDSVQE